MQDVYKALLDLQALDNEIEQAKVQVAQFGPKLESVEAPLKTLDRETEVLRSKLVDIRKDARRLEISAESKRDKLRQYEERAGRVRNEREQAAVRTELDLVRRATDADEQEALELMEQVTRTDLKLDDMDKQLTKLRAEVAPQLKEVLAARAEAESALASLQGQRQNQVIRIDAQALRLYERVHSGRNRRALAPLTVDGACGVCFNVLPVQQQAEIRAARTLMRCEACGVILYAEE
jgi:uncharacterized protein